MTARYIQKQLVKFNEAALPNSFVALSAQLDQEGNPYHAGIVIRLDRRNFLHHYCGSPEVIDDFEPGTWYIYKVIDIIKVDDNDEVASFLEHCRRVCGKSKIVYSCVLDGSAYNAEGEYISNTGLPELGTCVGFCVNTLSLFCVDADSYLEVQDWDELSVPENFPLDNFGQRYTFARYPNLDRGLYNAYKRRVSPLEYICSAFVEQYPIRKQQIDDIIENVQFAIEKKFSQ